MTSVVKPFSEVALPIMAIKGAAYIHVSSRFWVKVTKSKGCWVWSAGKGSGGYGQIKIFGRAEKAHRVAAVLSGLKLMRGMSVCHTCDNPPCVKPSHLFIGSHGDNMRDMSRKGRSSGQLKTTCPQGHPYAGKNLKQCLNGPRTCRICRNIQWNTWAHKVGRTKPRLV